LILWYGTFFPGSNSSRLALVVQQQLLAKDPVLMCPF